MSDKEKAKQLNINESEGTQDIENSGIVTEMKSSYINYAMSVIVARALPDVKDGLKPVQRRILYSMHKAGIKPGTPYKKVARIVGDTMGKYHPHGDQAIGDALVRMAQDFSFRYPLVDGQGNFGSIDGDPPAAMRYIEARLDKNSEKMLEALDKRTVDFVENYDGNETEPVVLPNIMPNLLINGGEGIAVGMATKIPPHNLTEISNAIIKMLDAGNSWDDSELKDMKIDYGKDVHTEADLDKLPKNRFYQFDSDISTDELLKEVQGPDFPTGAEIYNRKEVTKLYETGKGRIVMRAVSEIEEMKNGRFRIVVTELPYQVNKATLLSKIAQLYKDKKIDGIADIRDESSREGIRIIVELKRDSRPKTVQNRLYKYTELQKAFNANMLALVDGDPQLLTLKQMLELYISHRQEITTRRYEYELAKLREREHILEGLMIALDNIDEIIETIRNSEDSDAAKQALMDKFELSEIQAQAILDMQLRRLAALERKKIEDEYKEVKKNIKETLAILTTPEKVLEIIKGEVEELRDKYGDERQTKAFKGEVGEVTEEDLIPNEETFVTISEQGYIKRVKDTTYKSQKRGGVGKKAMVTKDGDAVRHVFLCETHDKVLFFSNQGKVYSLKVYEIPEYSRTAKGIPMVNLINLNPDELVTSVLTRKASGKILDEDTKQEGEEEIEKEGKHYKYLFMTTKSGTVKKTEIDEFDNIRSNGLIAINLEPNDELIWVKPTDGEDEIIMATRLGKSIRFNEADVRDTGRNSKGVRGIRLKEGDKVISMDVIREKETFILNITEKGYGKLTELSQYSVQKRGGTGLYTAKLTKKTGNLVIARILDHPQKELLILSSKGQAVRIPTDGLPVQNRQTSGVRLMKVKSGDSVAATAIV